VGSTPSSGTIIAPDLNYLSHCAINQIEAAWGQDEISKEDKMKNKNFIFSIALFLSIFIILFSCGKQKAKWQGTIEVVDGMTVVKNPKEPMYGEDVFILEEELSIGEAEGREEYMFSQIRHITISEDERIFVLDSKEDHIKAFDKEGKYLKTIGTPGQGPGELDRPSSICISQSELVVLEGARRFSVFSLEGEFLRHISTKETWALRASMDSVGNIVLTEGVMDPEYFHYMAKKVDVNMNLLYEIAKTPAPDARTGVNPFMPFAYWQIDEDDNIVFGYPKDYEIQILNPEGTIIKKIKREYDPVEVTEQEEKEQSEDSPPQIKYIFPKYHSAYYRFFLDDEGRIFVQTWEKIEGEEIYYHDIFDSDGKYVVKVPLRMRPIICKKNKLYTIEEDEEGYQYIKDTKSPGKSDLTYLTQKPRSQVV